MNSKRGAVMLEVDGETIAVRVTTNGMVRYQDETDETFLDGITALQTNQTDLRRMRALFWAGVCHIDGMTLDRAGDIMDAVGMAEAMDALSEAAELAFPNAEPETEGNGKAGKTPAKTKT